MRFSCGPGCLSSTTPEGASTTFGDPLRVALTLWLELSACTDRRLLSVQPADPMGYGIGLLLHPRLVRLASPVRVENLSLGSRTGFPAAKVRRRISQVQGPSFREVSASRVHEGAQRRTRTDALPFFQRQEVALSVAARFGVFESGEWTLTLHPSWAGLSQVCLNVKNAGNKIFLQK